MVHGMSEIKLWLDPASVVGPVQRRIFGALVEHLGRCVYDGLYEPTHPLANRYGFRADVMEMVRELGVTTLRYPGGNFVSGYKWEDGVGRRDRRPRRLALAWHALETNEVGLHEFAHWAREVSSELMLVLNLGTRGVQEALDLLEYTNVRSGSTLSDMRVTNGSVDPFNVRMWCLGNEMDGPWQLGHGDADAYAAMASQTAKAMRQLDPEVELVVCGSSNPEMPTFGSWDRTVLRQTYEDVDYISSHAYYWERDGDIASFLASSVHMDRYIDALVDTADSVRDQLHSQKMIDVSFDEWGVWYMNRFEDQRVTGIDRWPVAPRLLEDQYSVLDGVVSGSLLVSLLRHADRVKAACMAQLVNVVAPIMTEPGGSAWRQTTFYPFECMARLARGEVIGVIGDTPTYRTEAYGSVPLIDAAATYDRNTNRVAVFVVNRAVDASKELSVDLARFGRPTILEALSLADPDIRAGNTRDDPTRVRLHENGTARVEGREVTITLPPVSWTVLSIGLGSSES